jgi:hypothetical protein
MPPAGHIGCLALRSGAVDVIIRGCAGLRVLIQGGTEIGPFVLLRSSPVLCLED